MDTNPPDTLGLGSPRLTVALFHKRGQSSCSWRVMAVEPEGKLWSLGETFSSVINVMAHMREQWPSLFDLWQRQGSQVIEDRGELD